MKTLSLLLLSLLAVLSMGCTQYLILFKPPAQMDPMPKFAVEAAAEGSEEKASWSMEAIGLNESFYKKADDLNGNVNVKVAILSTGVDYNHEDLIGQVFVNKSEITEAVDIKPSINYKDDDDNGRIDDIVGYDFVDNDGLAYDRHGAGTAVAGIIAAKANGRGVKGVVDKVSLIPIRYINANGQSNVPLLVQALEAAYDSKADVVFVQNIHVGIGAGFAANVDVMAAEHVMVRNALKKFRDSETPIVVGAGEELKDFFNTPMGKVFRGFKNVIAVASVTEEGYLSLLSNHGNRSVATSAPGNKVLTTAPDNKYVEVRGSAYAAAHVAGVLALAKSKYGENLKLKEHILPSITSPRSVTESRPLEYTIQSGGIFNATKFMELLAEKM